MVDLGVKGIVKQNQIYQLLIMFLTEMNAGLQYTYNLWFVQARSIHMTGFHPYQKKKLLQCCS